MLKLLRQAQSLSKIERQVQHDIERISMTSTTTMASADLSLLKKLRTETGISFADCKKALEETDNNYEKALEWLSKHGIEKAAKKSDRTTSQGLLEAYAHNGRIVSVVELLCETDFVARTDEFKKLAHEIAMQVSSMKPKDVESLLKQEYIREPQKTIEQLIKETIAKLGENIVLKRFTRLELGSE